MPGVRVAEDLAHTLRMRPGCDTFLAQAQRLLPVLIPLGFGAVQDTAVRTFSNVHQAVQTVLAKPEVQQRLERVGVEAGTLPSAQFQKLLDADFVSAGQIVKAAGTQLD